MAKRPWATFHQGRRNSNGWRKNRGRLIKCPYIWLGLAILGRNLHLLLTHLTYTLAHGASEHHLPSAQPVTGKSTHQFFLTTTAIKLHALQRGKLGAPAATLHLNCIRKGLTR